MNTILIETLCIERRYSNRMIIIEGIVLFGIYDVTISLLEDWGFSAVVQVMSVCCVCVCACIECTGNRDVVIDVLIRT